MRLCYINSCRCAAANGGKRIVFPILGIGIYGYNRRQGLAVAIQSMYAYFEDYPQTPVQSVALAIMDGATYSEAKSLMRGITGISFRTHEAKALRMKFENDYKDSPRRQEIQIPNSDVHVCSFVNN